MTRAARMILCALRHDGDLTASQLQFVGRRLGIRPGQVVYAHRLLRRDGAIIKAGALETQPGRLARRWTVNASQPRKPR